MKRLLPLLFLFFPVTLWAQNSIEGRIHNLDTKTIYLLSFYGEKSTTIDSIIADPAGRFLFTIAPGKKPGMYRVQWGKDNLVDLIWNRENISFETNSLTPSDSLVIINSVENRIYYDYSKKDRNTQSRLELLMPVVDYYPVHDSYYYLTAAEMERIQKEQARLLDSLDQAHPGSYSARIFRLYQTPFLASGLKKEERLKVLQQHYFDKVNFNDTSLLHSPAFANKAISYLALYSDNRLDKKHLEAEFIRAVTIMLSAASVNPDVFKFLLDYLVSGFDKYHFDEVITYIADNFQDPFSCEDQKRKSNLQKKLETFKKIAVGKVAPAIELPDQKGKMVTLAGIQTEYTLLVFWSTECPHCTDFMPRLKALYDSQKPKRFEVLAVSVDTSRTAWTDFIRKEKLNWPNVSDLQGFAGKAADDYNIYATPTMFLLDKEKVILSKPISFRETEQALRDQKLLP
ncbi:MAG: redoxin domain-containing protein [bacterium]